MCLNGISIGLFHRASSQMKCFAFLLLKDGKSPTSPNPKGLDILVAAAGSHPLSDGYPPPDLVPSSAGSLTSSDQSKEMAEDDRRSPSSHESLDQEGRPLPVSPAILRPTPLDQQRAESPAAKSGAPNDCADVGPTKRAE